MTGATHREIHRSGMPLSPRQTTPARSHDTPVGDSDYRQMQDEIKRLAATNAELLASVRPAPAVETTAEPSHEADVQELLEENASLRRRVAELEEILEKAADMEDAWLAKQKEYEGLIDEKSEVIRALHLKVTELEQGPRLNKEDLPNAEELLELQRQLEEERQRMKEDEEAMMQQMQQMELTMSKERADLARQRAELQRLQADLNREMEIASRDPGLRERLAALQRRQDSGARKMPPTPPTPTPAAPAPTQQSSSSAKQTGIFKRFFG